MKKRILVFAAMLIFCFSGCIKGKTRRLVITQHGPLKWVGSFVDTFDAPKIYGYVVLDNIYWEGRELDIYANVEKVPIEVEYQEGRTKTIIECVLPLPADKLEEYNVDGVVVSYLKITTGYKEDGIRLNERKGEVEESLRMLRELQNKGGKR